MTELGDDKAIKFMVRSAEDVTMLSAFLQDALIAHHDIHYDKAAGEVMIVADRYRWEASANRDERVLMGLRIGKIRAVYQSQMPPPNAADEASAFYNLLTFAYEQGQDGSQSLHFTFSAGAALRLEIDDLMMSAGDIAPPRPAIAKPSHEGSGR